jgi:YHS domain-containing protein
MGDLLDFVLLLVTVRALWRLLSGVMRGMKNRPPPAASRFSTSSTFSQGAPEHGVQMARDPVCGTFVVPERAVSLTDGTSRVYFCSASCRDRYRPQHVEGRAS